MSLLDDVEAFLVKWSMPVTRFGTLAVAAPNLVERLRKGRMPRERTEQVIRGFMLNYDGTKPAQTMSVRDQVRAEADQHAITRDQARRLGGVAGASQIVVDRDPVAAVLEIAGPQSIGEAIRVVQQRWPATWSRIVAEARDRRQPPGALMVELIEQGLGAEVGR